MKASRPASWRQIVRPWKHEEPVFAASLADTIGGALPHRLEINGGAACRLHAAWLLLFVLVTSFFGGSLAASPPRPAAPSRVVVKGKLPSPINVQVLSARGATITSAEWRLDRGARVTVVRLGRRVKTQARAADTIEVHGRVEQQFGYSNVPGSHIDITLFDHRGRRVASRVARYLPDDLSSRPRGPMFPRAVFAEPFAVPARDVARIQLRYHDGPDAAGQPHD